METLHVSTDTSATASPGEERRRSRFLMAVSIAAALLVTVALFAGYMLIRKRHAEQIMAEQQQAQAAAAKPAPSPEVQVFVDEAMIKGAQIMLGGTLLNISQHPLTGLSVDMELRRRNGNSVETRNVRVEPADLQPNQQGRYALQVLSKDYSMARVLRIKSSGGGNNAAELAFKTSPGAQRPPESPQQKTIIVNRPPPRNGNGDFINTPDNPTRVP